MRIRFHFKAGRARHDPEKMVLPGLLFCSREEPAAAGFLIAAGWWDYHISMLVAWPRGANGPEVG